MTTPDKTAERVVAQLTKDQLETPTSFTHPAFQEAMVRLISQALQAERVKSLKLVLCGYCSEEVDQGDVVIGDGCLLCFSRQKKEDIKEALIDKYYERGRSDEREACARMALETPLPANPKDNVKLMETMRKRIAQAIRNRGDDAKS